MTSPRNLRRGVPTIACYNRSERDLGCDFDELIEAMQIYVDKHVAPIWGTPARLVKASKYRKNAWTLVFVDRFTDPGDANYLGYHRINRERLPKSIVFVKSAVEDTGDVSLTASHELVEMLVDPAVNLYSLGPRVDTFYAYESSDPVEESYRLIKGLQMCNFVYPEYFEEFHKPRSMKFDWLGEVEEPFQIMPGGYQSIFNKGEWKDLHGSTAKAGRFAKEDRRGHRSEFRKVGGHRRKPEAKPAVQSIVVR